MRKNNIEYKIEVIVPEGYTREELQEKFVKTMTVIDPKKYPSLVKKI
jgi:hypothetical protein